MYFAYGETELSYLRQKDKRLGALIDRVGHVQRAVDTDLFSSVVHHIIGQQILTKAQATIWQRLQDALGYDDLAIQRGLRMVYHHRKVDRRLFEKYRRRFSPYCSVASLYLWAVAGGAIPEMRDYLPRPKTGGKGNAEHRRSV